MNDAIPVVWDRLCPAGDDRRREAPGRRFRRFGDGSAICFPIAALYGEEYIEIGEGCIIGPYCTLSAGVMPGHVPDHDPSSRSATACLIGKGSGIVGHPSVEIGDDVFTGHHVYVTDANHGYEDVDAADRRAVRRAAPGRIGRGLVARPRHGRAARAPTSAATSRSAPARWSPATLPDFCVAVGNPARVIRRYVDG